MKFRSTIREVEFQTAPERYYGLLKAVTDTILVMDDTGALSGVNWIECLEPEDRAIATEAIAKALATQQPTTAEFQTVTPSQESVWFRVKFSPIPSSSKSEVVLVAREINERQRTEEALRESEERFSCAFQYAAIGMALVSPDGKWLKVNRSLSVLLGYSENELMTKTFQDITHPEDLGTDLNYVHQMLAGEIRTYNMEKRYIHKSGAIIWVRLSVSLVRDQKRDPLYFVSQIENITERKQAELLLTEAEQRWSFALEGAGDGVWDWNILEGTVFFSKRWREMLGYEESEVLAPQAEWSDRIHPDHRAQVMANLKNHLEGNGPYSNEHQLRCKDGSYKWFLARGMVVSRSPEGAPLRMIGTCADISRIKQAEDKLILTAKLASLGELSAGIAHEINNPLAVISGSITLLAKNMNDPAKVAEKVEVLKRATERIKKIVSGLSKFSRSSKKNEFSIHCLSEIVRESLLLTQERSQCSGIQVSSELKSDAKISCDEIEIEQVVINLINNAFDAVKSLAEKWIKIQVLEGPDSVRLRVTDSGAGIPEAIQNRLFDPFFTTKGVGEGTGLGLSIAKGILDEHQATITLLSDEQNTCFEVSFPKV